MRYVWLQRSRSLAVAAALLAWLMGASLAGAAERDMAAIVESGELRVGVSIYAPWSMRNRAGELIGAEVDVARRLAADMGVEPKLREYPWQQLIPALLQGEIDVIAAGMSITPQRALQVAYSQPYRRSGIGLATNLKLTGTFKSLSQLNSPNVAIAVMADTQSAQLAERLFSKASIKPFKDEAQVEKALVDGLVHAFVRANPAPRYLALRHPKIIDVPLDQPLLESREGFAVRKGDADFVNFLNAWIVAREDDAWLPSTDKYWFDSLGWQEQVQP